MTAKISEITLATTAAAEDWLEIERAADGLSRRISKENLMGATLTGGGAVATGGFTLTIPATGTAVLKTGTPITGRIASWAGANTVQDGGFAITDIARLSQVQTFTANQRIDALVGVNVAPASEAQVSVVSAAAGRRAMIIDTAASPTVPVVSLRSIGTTEVSFLGNLAGTFDRINAITAMRFDNGAGAGRRIILGSNNNGSTPAAGHILLDNLSQTTYRIWPDATGLVRIHTADPTNANDTAGVVVGAQTSAAAAKDIDDQLPDWRESINHIVEAVQAGALRSWKYKSDAYNGEHYPIGIVTDYAERYGQDKNRSLNVPVAIGDLMGAVVALAERVAELEGRT